MSNNWIYVGADIHNQQWSKVGKTTVGLSTRHTSSQNPGYFIYTAFNIVNGDVHQIESNLLGYLESLPNVERLNHFSTGSKSECFLLNPYDMNYLVESFLNINHSSCVPFDNLINEMSRYQCDNTVYEMFITPPGSNQQQKAIPHNLSLSSSHYFTGNQVEHEADLGNGYFVDFETGRQGYRDEYGNIEWDW